jgi:CcmD family protein
MSRAPMRLHHGDHRNVDFSGSKSKNRLVSSLAYLAAVNIVIWIGLFFYVWRLDRRLTERERNR